jgi:ABC-type transport system involved in cytochrome c biogenesis permease subunit
MLYIHPPIAIIGYFFAFLFAIFLFKNSNFDIKIAKMAGILVWLFTLIGLLTGMLWAQLALGSYWSWDPKEIMTLTLFLTVSLGQLLYFEKKYTATKWLTLISCALVIMTG